MAKGFRIPGQYVPVTVDLGMTGPAEAARSRGSTLQSFVPDPLPPKIHLPGLLNDLHAVLLRAERALGLLEGTARRLANPHVLIGPFMRREAILSSAIEDTFASIEDVARVEANLQPRDSGSEAHEVANYVRAVQQALASEMPISNNLLRQLHATLLEGTRGANRDPGNFRRVQNFIGRGGDVRFIPPPPQYLADLLSNLEGFVHGASALPLLFRVAITHYQFETIHPFLDGNGRIGRLLITLQLCREARISRPLVYVSGYFERNRTEYYDRLLAVSRTGDWRGWIGFFLAAVASQAEDAERRANDLLALQQRWHEMVRFRRASGLLPTIVDHLFEQPWVTVRSVSTKCGITGPAAVSLVRHLERLKIINQVTTGTYGRTWFAPGVFDIITREYLQ